MPDRHLFTTQNTHFTADLPPWAIQRLNQMPDTLPSLEERMTAVIDFARWNFENDTGGPFAAGVFEQAGGRLIALGVNRVMPLNCSTAHAEIMALSLAQKRLGVYDLGGQGLPAHQIVVNWRPCTMCLGAVLWSGVRSLVIAGDGPELETITGFDEGPVHPQWRRELNQRGIEVVEGILRDPAIAVFSDFAASQKVVYNARQGSSS